ncbi:hypothetical protein JZO76_07265 [Enterococcus sp. MJM12]|uniref:DUF1642 domain-containing protein n=1 Tax=Candidatus Enterococcus myersii TaxID=2815322 RepID=A0ABS3H7A0_9ENTE|nr:hypothetical protein [Enterococcus sp. MJM12]MBO0449338.1 hypothetical protein [Enterococcus sp. MJM12]
MKCVVSKFNDDGSIYPVYECEDEEEAMKMAYACNGVYENVSPSLTDDQQVVLEWLKEKMTLTDIEPIELIWRLKVNSTKSGYRDMPVYKSYRRLTPAQQFQVLAAFAEWGSKGDE